MTRNGDTETGGQTWRMGHPEMGWANSTGRYCTTGGGEQGEEGMGFLEPRAAASNRVATNSTWLLST